jgi:hypothetical protein
MGLRPNMWQSTWDAYVAIHGQKQRICSYKAWIEEPLWLQLVILGMLDIFLLVKVETPYHDNDLILTPIISSQSG